MKTSFLIVLTVGAMGAIAPACDQSSNDPSPDPTAGAKADGPYSDPSDLDKALEENREHVGIELGGVQRLSMVVRSSAVSSIIGDIQAQDISLEVDGYDRVFMEIPWTAKKVGEFFEEYSLVILEFKGTEEVHSQLSGVLDSQDQDIVLDYSVGDSERGLVTVISGRDNPNPVKWFNRTTPASDNYSASLQAAYRTIVDSDGYELLEVNAPLQTDDTSAIAEQVATHFDGVSVVAVDVGVEHFVTPPDDDNPQGMDFAYPTVRMVFDASEMNDGAERLRLLETIELFHSYNVPVMRYYSAQ